MDDLWCDPREELIEQYKGLVRKIAHRLSSKFYSAEDLYTPGVEGLLAAHERFDPDRGLKFITFAYPYIKGNMQHYIRDHGSFVRSSHGIRSCSFSLFCELDHDLLDISEFGLQDGTWFTELQLDVLMKDLSSVEKAVLKKLYIEEKTQRIIARELGYCETMIGKYKNRALKKLKKVIEDEHKNECIW